MPLGALSISNLISALASLFPAKVTVDSNVIDLTAENFEAFVAMEPLTLVLFTVPQCNECKDLASEYEKAATALKEKNIKVTKIACDKEVEFCKSNDIRSFPTLKVYKDGTPTNYIGPLLAPIMVQHMIGKHSLPLVSEVTAANHDDFIKSNRIIVVAYLPSSDSESARIFTTVAENQKMCRDSTYFGLSINPASAAAANVTPPAIVAYRTFDEPRIDYPHPNSAFNVQEIGYWLDEISIPGSTKVCSLPDEVPSLADLHIDIDLDELRGSGICGPAIIGKIDCPQATNIE